MRAVCQRWLAPGFLAVTIPIETAYSWPHIFFDPYYGIKLVGWTLLAVGILQRGRRPMPAMAFTAAGWGWFAANFGRALADRVGRMAADQDLRAGSLELWFTGGCLLVALIGLVSTLSRVFRSDQD